MQASELARRHLEANPVYRTIRTRFDRVPEERRNPDIRLSVAHVAGYALSALREFSLNAFHRNFRNDANLERIFHDDHVPSDTQIRAFLDAVKREALFPTFKDVYRRLLKANELEKFVFLDGCFRVALNGTGGWKCV